MSALTNVHNQHLGTSEIWNDRPLQEPWAHDSGGKCAVLDGRPAAICSQLPNQIPSLPLLRTNPQIMDEIMEPQNTPNASIYHHTFFQGSRMIKIYQDFRGDANHSVKGFSQPSTHPTRPWQTLPSIACFLAKWPHLLPSTTDAGHNGKSDGAHSPPRMQVHKRGRVAIKNSQICWIGTGNVCNSPVRSDISQRFRSAKPPPNSPAIDGRVASESQVW